MIMQILRDRLNNQRGWIMLEILLVVVILGILAIEAMPHYVGTREDAQRTQTKNDIKAITQQIQIYAAQTGSYPPSGLGAMTTALTSKVSINGQMKGPWMTRVPQVDQWNNAFVWTYTAGTTAELRSTGNGDPIAIDLISGTVTGF